MMNRIVLTLLACVGLGLECLHAIAQESVETTGEVISVTLQRSGAMVTRRVTVPDDASGKVFVRVELPSSVERDSVYAFAATDAEIDSFRLESWEEQGAIDDQVKKLEQAFVELNEEIQAATFAAKAVQADLDSLDQLASFSKSSVETDLNRGLLDVDAVKQLLDYQLEKRQLLTTRQFEQEQEIKRIEGLIKRNNEQLSLLAERTLPTRYAAEIQLRKIANSASFKLSYRVNDCGWTPKYTLKSNSAVNKVSLSGFAQVIQNTGEDWSNVQLSLTDASEQNNVELLELTPLRVKSSALNAGDGIANDMYGEGLYEGDEYGDGMYGEALFGSPGSLTDGGVSDSTLDLNFAAAKQQLGELTRNAERKQFSVGQETNDLTGVAWEFADKVSVPSTENEITLRVFTVTPAIETYFVLTPLLGSHAQRLGVFKSGCEKPLWKGPVRIFRDDQLIGSTSLLAKAAGQPFSIPLGKETRLQTRRELLERTVQPKGGNQIITCKYRLVVSSVLDSKVECQLIDRIPMAIDGNSALVNLPAEVEKTLSKDPLYLRMQRPYGVLRWDVQIPAQRFGSDAVDFEYLFTTEIQTGTQLTSPNLYDSVGQDLRFRQYNGGMGGMGGMGGSMGSGGGF